MSDTVHSTVRRGDVCRDWWRISIDTMSRPSQASGRHTDLYKSPHLHILEVINALGIFVTRTLRALTSQFLSHLFIIKRSNESLNMQYSCTSAPFEFRASASGRRPLLYTSSTRSSSDTPFSTMSSQTTQAGGKAHLFTDKDKARIQKTQQVDGQIKKDSFPARVQSTVDSRNALNTPGTATGGNAAK